MTGKMLVGFDASEESYKAFDFALDMASSCKPASGISVLTVIQPPEGLYLVEADNLLNETTKQYQTLLQGLEEKARAKNIDINTEIAVGHPAETIVKFAQKKGCPLIVVGHRGRSKLEGLLLGSVSRNVAATAQCTVIIVRKD
ncbi:MAG: universal stress protein [Nitrospiraceae bacterium]|nr:universal stress protein [Nitrospiraceae bacterium]MDA8090911.1 universal stress protein [Nitrospiraceae bacterium]